MNAEARSGTDPELQMSTRELILQAALKILALDGFSSLTARNVAEEAGTNLALINYHFGGKQGLLLAIYDHLEREAYERQQAMYSNPTEPLSDQWRRAVEFYRQDLEHGFVRIHHELLARGYANPELAERARQRIIAWYELLHQVAMQHLTKMGITLPPHAVAAMLAAFWYGMEQQHLIGIREQEVPYFEILETIGDWIAHHET